MCGVKIGQSVVKHDPDYDVYLCRTRPASEWFAELYFADGIHDVVILSDTAIKVTTCEHMGEDWEMIPGRRSFYTNIKMKAVKDKHGRVDLRFDYNVDIQMLNQFEYTPPNWWIRLMNWFK